MSVFKKKNIILVSLAFLLAVVLCSACVCPALALAEESAGQAGGNPVLDFFANLINKLDPTADHAGMCVICGERAVLAHAYCWVAWLIIAGAALVALILIITLICAIARRAKKRDMTEDFIEDLDIEEEGDELDNFDAQAAELVATDDQAEDVVEELPDISLDADIENACADDAIIAADTTDEEIVEAAASVSTEGSVAVEEDAEEALPNIEYAFEDIENAADEASQEALLVAEQENTVAEQAVDSEQTVEQDVEQEIVEEAPIADMLAHDDLAIQEAVTEEAVLECEFDEEEELPSIATDDEDIENESDSESESEEDEAESGSTFAAGFTRYNKSFTAKLIQAKPETQAFYGIIKNHALGYKKMGARMSWPNDSLYTGRTTIGKFAIRGKSLYLYLALTEEEMASVHVTKTTEIKRYAAVPAFLVVKGSVSLRRAIKAIDIIASRLGLVFKGDQHEDYSRPYQTTEALIEQGLIKVITTGGSQFGRIDTSFSTPQDAVPEAETDIPEGITTDEAQGAVADDVTNLDNAEECDTTVVSIDLASAREQLGVSDDVAEAAPVEEKLVDLEDAVRRAYTISDSSLTENASGRTRMSIREARRMLAAQQQAASSVANAEAPSVETEQPTEDSVVVDTDIVPESIDVVNANEEVPEAAVQAAEQAETTDLEQPISQEAEPAISVADARRAYTDEVATQQITTSVQRSVGKKKTIINIDTISRAFAAGETVNLEALIARGLVPAKYDYIKVLARGYISKALTVVADDFSMDAVKMILLAGGKVEKLKD